MSTYNTLRIGSRGRFGLIRHYNRGYRKQILRGIHQIVKKDLDHAGLLLNIAERNGANGGVIVKTLNRKLFPKTRRSRSA